MRILKLIAICIIEALYLLTAWWWLPIRAEQSYGWAGGLLHGVLFLPNYIWSLVVEGHLWRAPLCTDAYMVWWWIGTVAGIIIFLIWGFLTRLYIFSDD